MQLIYLRKVKLEKNKVTLKKVINKIKILFNRIKLDKYDNNKVIITLPYEKEITQKQAKKILKKLNKKIKQKEVVISLCQQCKKEENLKEVLKNEKYIILDGKWLFTCLLINIIEYIAKIQTKKIEQYSISILANKLSKQEKEVIIELARKSKNYEYYY